MKKVFCLIFILFSNILEAGICCSKSLPDEWDSPVEVESNKTISIEPLTPLQGRKALMLTVLRCFGYSIRPEDIVWKTIEDIRVNRASIDRDALTEALRTISLQLNLSNFNENHKFIEELRQFLITEGADIFVNDNAILKNFFARGNWEGVGDMCVGYAKVAADHELMQIHRELFYDALLFCSQQSEPLPDNKDIFHKLVKILIQNCDVYQDDHRILRNFLGRNNWLGLQLLVLYAYETNIDKDVPLQFLLSALSTISHFSTTSKTSLGSLVMQTHQKIRDLHYQDDQFLLNCIANKYFGRVALHLLEDAKRNRTPYGLSFFNRCTLSGDKKIKEYIENQIKTLRKNIAPEHLWMEVEYQTYQLVPEPFVSLEFMQGIYRRCADKTPLMLDDIIVEMLNLRNELYGDQIAFEPSPLSETMVISEQEWEQSLEAGKKESNQEEVSTPVGKTTRNFYKLTDSQNNAIFSDNSLQKRSSMVKCCVLLFLLSMSTVYTGCWFSRSLEISEIPTKKTELLDIINEIQTRQANISSTYKRAKKLVKLLPVDALNDALLAIASTPLSEMYCHGYLIQAHLVLLKLAQRIVRKGGNIHYQDDEVFKGAAKNFPQLFAYLLKRSEYFKTPYCLATFRAIAEQNPNFIYNHVVNIYIQQLSMPQSRLELQAHVEFLAEQLVDKEMLNPEFIQKIIQRILTDKPIGTELIADDIIAAILQVRDAFMV